MVLLISFLAFLIIFGPFCLYGLFSILVSFDLFGVFWSFNLNSQVSLEKYKVAFNSRLKKVSSNLKTTFSNWFRSKDMR